MPSKNLSLDEWALRCAYDLQASQPRADYTIDQLPAGNPPIGTDEFAAYRNGQTYKLTVAGMQTLITANTIATNPPAYQQKQIGWFSVKDFGALGDGSTDDTAAIQSTISAAQANGGGLVWFSAGTFVTSSLLTITAGHVVLMGAGLNVTAIANKTPNGSAVSFAGTAGAPLANVGISGISLQAAGSATGAITANTTNVGLNVTYTTLSRFDNMQITGFFLGVSYFRATNTVTQRVFVSFNPNVAGTASGAVGFAINGNSSNAVNSGNASSVWRDCGADFSPAGGGYAATNVGSIGVRINGTYCGDLFFETFGVSWAYTSYSVDFSTVTPNAGGNGDVHFHNCTGDVYTYACWSMGSISAAPIDNLSMLNIIGGWASPYAGAATPYGVYAAAMRGIAIRSVMFMTATPTGTANQVGVTAVSCAGILVDGCHFVGQKYGVVPNGTTGMQITSNRFYSASGSPNTLFINVASGQRIGIANNTFDGYSAGGAIQFDSASSYCTALGNSIHQANMPMPTIIQGTGAGHQIANNVIS